MNGGRSQPAHGRSWTANDTRSSGFSITSAGRGCRWAPALLLLLMAAGAATADEGGWPTNFEQVQMVTRAAVSELLSEFPAPSGDHPVRVGFPDPHEASWLVEQVMGEELSGRGVSVVSDSLADATELEVRVIELGLSYSGTNRRNLLGRKRVERLTVATLSAQTRERAGGPLGWSGEADRRAIDEVPAAKLPLLEGHAYPFTAPTMPPSGSAKVIEPIVVSAIVVSLVFLFVSNRK